MSTDPTRRREAPSFEMSRAGWVRLFVALAAGSRAAFEDLYTVAARKLYGLALWHTGSPDDAAEVVQEVFVRLAERRDRLVTVREPRAWLLTVAHRIAVDHGRRSRRRRTEPLDVCFVLPTGGESPERSLDGERASALLATLPPAQRDVVYLRHFADCTFATIGKVMRISTFTAASRYRLGMAKLRRLMEGTQ